jgi:hypothetical protein
VETDTAGVLRRLARAQPVAVSLPEPPLGALWISDEGDHW